MPTNKPEYMHNYYINHRDHLNDIMREKVTCEICNKIIRRSHMTRHHKNV